MHWQRKQMVALKRQIWKRVFSISFQFSNIDVLFHMASSFCTRATDVPVLKKPQKFLKIAQAINLLKNNLKSRQNFGLLSRKFCCQKSPNLVTLSLSFCVIITQAMGGAVSRVCHLKPVAINFKPMCVAMPSSSSSSITIGKLLPKMLSKTVTARGGGEKKTNLWAQFWVFRTVIDFPSFSFFYSVRIAVFRQKKILFPLLGF